MQTTRKPLPFLLQLFDLLCMELSNWRWSWQVMVLTATVSPILSIIALGSFASRQDAESLNAIFAGSLVMSLMFGNLENVSSRFAYMRFSGALEYYATLPIRRSLLVIAVVLSFFVLSFPSLLVTIGFGAWFLHRPLMLHPLILLVIPLCVFPLAGIGAAIGAKCPTPEVGGGLTLLVTMLALFMGPVLLPASRLPEVVQGIGYLSPATYAASALKQTLLEPMRQRIVIDCIALTGFSLLTFWFVSRKLI
ncbi:ABC transporter permease [Cyanobacteria bacterium FACHB-63]|nr:ABC transporter permease [Cyanobacteria bacterium FACHB-63]